MYAGSLLLTLILFVKRSLIPIPANQDIWHPVRCPAHNIGYGFHGYILAAFDDQFIMDMTADEAVGEVLHSKDQKIPADSLHDILHEFWAVGFDAFPFLCGADTHVGNGFAAEGILSDAGLHVGEQPAGGKLYEEHAALIQELDPTDFCVDALPDSCFDSSAHIPPVGCDIRIGSTPGIYQRLQLVL